MATTLDQTTQAVGGYAYDSAGDVLNDGINTYLYDADGRLCAVGPSLLTNGRVVTQYIYDAEGTRVAKGTANTLWDNVHNRYVLSCDTTVNGFMPTYSYVIGPSGEQLTETDGSGDWRHTNVYADGELIATYDTVGLHFQLADWLGTRRVQTDSSGNTEETCTSLPFGNALNCPTTSLSTADDATEHHFTGKERDTESGNDYFGARYYASSMGRFMSPDPLPWIHLQHGNDSEQKKFAAFIASPQNFNMYAYVNNNPLNKTDPTGMNACGTSNDANCKVTVTIQDRTKDANGNYKDKFTGENNQQNYNATATVSVNGKPVATLLIDTMPSDTSKYATIQNGTYSATLVEHDGKPALALNGGGPVPVVGGRDPATGLSYARGALVHAAGKDNYTGMYFSQKLHAMAGVSEGCQTVCTSEYGRFLQAVGVQGQVGPPQHAFTVTLDTSENQ